MGINFEFEGKVYELPDGTTPEQAKAKILQHIGKSIEDPVAKGGAEPFPEEDPLGYLKRYPGRVVDQFPGAMEGSARMLAAVPGYVGGGIAGTVAAGAGGIEAGRAVQDAVQEGMDINQFMPDTEGRTQPFQEGMQALAHTVGEYGRQIGEGPSQLNIGVSRFGTVPSQPGTQDPIRDKTPTDANAAGAFGQFAAEAALNFAPLGAVKATRAIESGAKRITENLRNPHDLVLHPSGAPGTASSKISAERVAQKQLMDGYSRLSQMLEDPNVDVAKVRNVAALIKDKEALLKIPEEASKLPKEIRDLISLKPENTPYSLSKFLDGTEAPKLDVLINEAARLGEGKAPQLRTSTEAVELLRSETRAAAVEIAKKGKTSAELSKESADALVADLAEKLKRGEDPLAGPARDLNSSSPIYVAKRAWWEAVKAGQEGAQNTREVRIAKERIYSEENLQHPDTSATDLAREYKKEGDRAIGMMEKLRGMIDQFDSVVDKNSPEAGALADQIKKYRYILRNIHKESIVPLKTEIFRRLRSIEIEREVAQGRGDKPALAEIAGRERLLVESLDKKDYATMTSLFREDASIVGAGYDKNLPNILNTQGIYGALKYIVENHKDSYLYSVAKAFLDNPLIRPLLREYNLGKETAGVYKPAERAVGYSKAGKESIETVLHEIDHNATQRMLFISGEVLTARQKGLTPNRVLLAEFMAMPKAARNAAVELHSLFDSFQNSPHAEAFNKAFPFENNPISSVHELVAYGRTNPKAIAILDSISLVPETTAKSRPLRPNELVHKGIAKITTMYKHIIDNIREALGFSKLNKEFVTAFEHLYQNADILTKYSKGAGMTTLDRVVRGLAPEKGNEKEYYARLDAIKRNLQKTHITESPSEDIGAIRTAALATDDLGKTSFFASKIIFGWPSFQLQVNKWPVIHQALRAMTRGRDTSVAFKNFVGYGLESASDVRRFGPYVSLDHVNSGESIIHITKNASPLDREVVWRALSENTENTINHMTAIDTPRMAHLTESQRQLYEAYAKFGDRVLTFLDTKVFDPNNPASPFDAHIRSLIPKRDGWSHALRKGDFDVLAMVGESVLYAQRTRTKVHAEDLAERMRQDPNWSGTDILTEPHKSLTGSDAKTYIDSVVDNYMLDERRGLIPEGSAAAKRTELEAQLQRTGRIGSHHMYRENVPGFEGQKLYKTDAQQAKDFWNAIPDYIEEMSSLVNKAVVKRYVEPMLNDPHILNRRPNSAKMARFLSDQATHNYQDHFNSFWSGIRDFADSVYVEALKTVGVEHYPEVHVIERGLGIASHLFHNVALTSRAAFWSANFMTSPQAFRLALRQSVDNPWLAFEALGRGTIQLAHGGDVAFRRDLHLSRTESDVFNPRLMNELTSMGLNFETVFGSSKAAWGLSQMFRWGTGEMQSAIADSSSRLQVWAIMRELHMLQGKHGEPMRRAVQLDTDATMVAYGAAESPPWIRHTGIVGDVLSPLIKFGAQQTGNMVADMKFFWDHKTMASSLPLVATGLISLFFGGVVGTIGLAEYELWRTVIVGMRPEWETKIPSVVDFISKKEFQENRIKIGDSIDFKVPGPQGWLAYGMPSAATGLDIGSGLRWNPIISKSFTGDQDFIDLFTTIKFARDLGRETAVAIKATISPDQVTESDKRKAAMFLMKPIVSGSYFTDKTFGSETRQFVPGGERGFGQRKQSTREEMATLLGTSTLEARHQRDVGEVERKTERLRVEQSRKIVDLIVDGVEYKQPEKIRKAIDRAISLKLDERSLDESLERIYNQRHITNEQRFYMSPSGKVKSKESQRRYMLDQQYRVR
jgi:hypothetical protein